MRRDGEPFRRIAEQLEMSLGGVQKALRRSQKLADVLADDEPGDVIAAVGDDELKAGEVASFADIERLNELERYRLRHLPGPFGDAARARRWTKHPVE
jgi:hypothetical protein